jgi:hypothetical protein
MDLVEQIVDHDRRRGVDALDSVADHRSTVGTLDTVTRPIETIISATVWAWFPRGPVVHMVDTPPR